MSRVERGRYVLKQPIFSRKRPRWGPSGTNAIDFHIGNIGRLKATSATLGQKAADETFSPNIGRIDIAHFRLYPYKFILTVAERNCLGSFGSMKEDEKRNYLARKELQNYLVSIAREQLQVLLDTNQDATVACFECCRASKELTVDKHFKKIAFCG